MEKYISNTGYVKRIETGEAYEAKELYLGKYDNAKNYEDITKEEYEEYLKAQEEKANGNDNEIR